MTEEFSEVLKIITFLQMTHGSLKEVGSTVEAKMSVCGLITLFTLLKYTPKCKDFCEYTPKCKDLYTPKCKDFWGNNVMNVM